MRDLPDRRFWHISVAGIFFQGGAAAVDTSTIIAALVHALTAGSAFAVGAAAAISRFGWLFPQLFVAFYAQQRMTRLPFYMAGAFGRVAAEELGLLGKFCERTWPRETGLAGWACRTRTQKCRRKLSP